MAGNKARRFLACSLILLLLVPLSVGCKARLTLIQRSGDKTVSAPRLSGTGYASKVSEQLIPLFDPLLQTVSALQSEGIDVALQYKLTTTDAGSVLQTTLAGKGTASATASKAMMNKGQVSLPDLSIGPKGELTGTEGLDAEMFADREYFRNLLLLSGLGVSVDVSDYGSEATRRGVADVAVSLYEKLSGKPIDIQNSRTADSLYAKACATDLFEYVDSENLDASPISINDFYAAASAFQNNLYGVAHTDLARVATVKDALDVLSLLLSPSGLLGSKSVAQIMQESNEDLQDPVTRALWATLCRRCFEQLITRNIQNEYYSYPVEDSTSADVKFVMGYGLVQSYPGFNTYTPNQNVRLYQLAGLGAHLASRMCLLNVDPELLVNEQEMPNHLAIRYFASLAAYCLDSTGANDTKASKVNDRSYSFYYRQADTGKYSDVNCMPTLTCMCLKWQNEDFSKTPGQIRSETDPDGTGGWSLMMAEDALSKNNGRFDQWSLSYSDPEANIKKMIAELDRGCVLFCMINEGDLKNSGHCLQVYGYEKDGDSVWFYCNDPGYGVALDVFGKPMGQGRKLEAHYAEWITRRWAFAILSILP